MDKSQYAFKSSATISNETGLDFLESITLGNEATAEELQKRNIRYTLHKKAIENTKSDKTSEPKQGKSLNHIQTKESVQKTLQQPHAPVNKPAQYKTLPSIGTLNNGIPMTPINNTTQNNIENTSQQVIDKAVTISLADSIAEVDKSDNEITSVPADNKTQNEIGDIFQQITNEADMVKPSLSNSVKEFDINLKPHEENIDNSMETYNENRKSIEREAKEEREIPQIGIGTINNGKSGKNDGDRGIGE